MIENDDEIVQYNPVLTKEQIGVITDAVWLQDYIDELEENIEAIEVNLEFSERDDEWRSRAMGALIYNRVGRARCKKQLEQLTGKAGKRADDEAKRKTRVLAIKEAEVKRLRAMPTEPPADSKPIKFREFL